jgi:hypothetical protein
VSGAAADARLSAIASEITKEVAQLYARGVQHVLVAGIPDVGLIPDYTGAANEAASDPHAVLIVCHAGLPLADLSGFTGWSLIIDEAMNLLEHRVEETGAMLGWLEANYQLAGHTLRAMPPRKARDLTRQQDGSFIWNDPESSIGYDSPWNLSPASIRVARSLAKFGAFNAQGLAIIHRIWAAQSFTGPEHAMRCDELIRETLKALIEANLVSADAEGRDAGVIYGSWQMPMYAIDTRSTEASLEDLHAAQERELYAQM